MSGGYGGWGAAGNQRISGRALVRNESRAFGFGRKEYTITGSHLGLQSEYHLFAAYIELIRRTRGQQRNAGKRAPKTQVRYLWSRAIPFYPRAMLLAGKTLLAAGPSEILDFSSESPTGDVCLWAIATEDGTKSAEYRLKAAPVYDSFAASQGNLYFTTVDGRVVCYQPEKSIHQPVPVVRRFDGDDLEPLAERLQAFQDGRQPVRQSFPEQLLVPPIRDNIHRVVAMQIDAAE